MKRKIEKIGPTLFLSTKIVLSSLNTSNCTGYIFRNIFGYSCTWNSFLFQFFWIFSIFLVLLIFQFRKKHLPLLQNNILPTPLYTCIYFCSLWWNALQGSYLYINMNNQRQLSLGCGDFGRYGDKKIELKYRVQFVYHTGCPEKNARNGYYGLMSLVWSRIKKFQSLEGHRFGYTWLCSFYEWSFTVK